MTAMYCLPSGRSAEVLRCHLAHPWRARQEAALPVWTSYASHMPDDPELTACAWETERARELGQRYGCVVIHGPGAWQAKRGHGADVENLPPRPALSDVVLECHLHDRWYREATKSA